MLTPLGAGLETPPGAGGEELRQRRAFGYMQKRYDEIRDRLDALRLTRARDVAHRGSPLAQEILHGLEKAPLLWLRRDAASAGGGERAQAGGAIGRRIPRVCGLQHGRVLVGVAHGDDGWLGATEKLLDRD